MRGIFTGGITQDATPTNRDQLDSKEIDKLTTLLAVEKKADTDWARQCGALEAECDHLLKLLDDFYGADKNPARQPGNARRHHIAAAVSREAQPADPQGHPSMPKAHGGKRGGPKSARLSRKNGKHPLLRWPRWLARGNPPWGGLREASQDS
jgi:hypothetical protein